MRIVVITETNVGVALAHELAVLGVTITCVHLGEITLSTHLVRPIPTNVKMLYHYVVGHQPDVVINTSMQVVARLCLLPYRTLYVHILPTIIDDVTVYNEMTTHSIRAAKIAGHSVVRCGVMVASFRCNQIIFPARVYAITTQSNRTYHLSSFKTLLRFVIRWILESGAPSSSILMNEYCWTIKDIREFSGFNGLGYCAPQQFDLSALPTIKPPKSPLFGDNPDHTLEELQNFYDL